MKNSSVKTADVQINQLVTPTKIPRRMAAMVCLLMIAQLAWHVTFVKFYQLGLKSERLLRLQSDCLAIR